MDDELHPAGFVEEALENDGVERRQAEQGRTAGGQILHQLRSGRLAEADRVRQPRRRRAGTALQPQLDIRSKPRHGRRQFIAAARRLPQPERNGRRLAVGILDAHGAALHPQYPIRRVAQLEYIALQALDREILVDRAHREPFRLEDDLVVGVVGNRAARGDGREPRALARAQQAIDGIVMDERTMAAAARTEPLRQHRRRTRRNPAASGRDRGRRRASARTIRPRTIPARRLRR